MQAVESQSLEEVFALKIRIKFAKTGNMKFVGHLDMLRYFQKAMRRADVDIAYSEGYSPHQIMSFAAPLGVGLTSIGEYFDIEVNSTYGSKDMIQRINQVLAEGTQIIDYVELPADSKNAMSILAAADYEVKFRDGYKPDILVCDKYLKFLNQETIEILKKTKKSEKIVNIRSMIFETKLLDNDIDNPLIFMKLATGSTDNLKPELVMQAFYTYIGLKPGQFDFEIKRLELYGKYQDKLIPLKDFGTLIEN